MNIEDLHRSDAAVVRRYEDDGQIEAGVDGDAQAFMRNGVLTIEVDR